MRDYHTTRSPPGILFDVIYAFFKAFSAWLAHSSHEFKLLYNECPKADCIVQARLPSGTLRARVTCARKSLSCKRTHRRDSSVDYNAAMKRTAAVVGALACAAISGPTSAAASPVSNLPNGSIVHIEDVDRFYKIYAAAWKSRSASWLRSILERDSHQ